MKDIRISIRLSSEEHKAFKIAAIKKGISMQELLLIYVRKEIEKEKSENGKNN